MKNSYKKSIKTQYLYISEKLLNFITIKQLD